MQMETLVPLGEGESASMPEQGGTDGLGSKCWQGLERHPCRSKGLSALLLFHTDSQLSLGPKWNAGLSIVGSGFQSGPSPTFSIAGTVLHPLLNKGGNCRDNSLCLQLHPFGCLASVCIHGSPI